MSITLKNITLNNPVLNNTKHDLQNKESKITGEESKKKTLQVALEKIKKSVEGNNFATEEEKDRYQNKLNEKIRLGSKLSQSEMSYLERTNPTMYMHIKRVQLQREMLEKQLKQCRSKKEVQEAYTQAMAMIHKKDPDKQLLISAYNNVTEEFKKTREYKNLPEDIKDNKNEIIKRKGEAKFDLFV